MTATLNHPEIIDLATTTFAASRGPSNRPDQCVTDAHDASVGPVQLASDHKCRDSQNPTVAGTNVPADHMARDPRTTSVGGDLNSPAPNNAALPTLRPAQVPNSPADQETVAAQESHVGRGQTTESDQGRPEAHGAPVALGPILRDPLLSIMADAVDDLERVRIATENRYRQLTRDVADEDGEFRGFGLDESVPEVKRVKVVLDGLIDLEHKSVLNLQREVRKHPLWIGFASYAKGVGEKQFARLLAVLGDPYWNDLHDRPRTVSELWAYCGFHVVHPGQYSTDAHGVSAGVAPKRQRGQKSNWNEDARKRTWLITGACLKAQGHYSDVYYAAREKYREATHKTDCVRCGPAGKPALAGSPLSAAHQHARGLRAIAKEFLKDLWRAGRDYHEEQAA